MKQFFGAGTVKLELSVPPSVPKAGLQVPGKISLNALSDQHIIEVTVLLEEEWQTGRGEEKQTKTFELGKVTLAQAIDMKQGEQRVLDFVLPFELVKSNADDLKEKGRSVGYARQGRRIRTQRSRATRPKQRRMSKAQHWIQAMKRKSH